MSAQQEQHAHPHGEGDPVHGAAQVPLEGSELKPKDLSGAVVWTQDKEKVVDVNHGEAESRRERGKSIEDAGGKSDEL